MTQSRPSLLPLVLILATIGFNSHVQAYFNALFSLGRLPEQGLSRFINGSFDQGRSAGKQYKTRLDENGNGQGEVVIVQGATVLARLTEIGPDAHSPGSLAWTELGVAMARKGWLERDDILNTRDAAGVVAFAKRRRP